MIKFFRKIRQNLLMENKTGKYFKYAIGEIVLVVIGILIALQINNWNEKRNNNIIVNSVLKQIHSELANNIKGIDQISLSYKYKDSLIRLIMNNKLDFKNFIGVPDLFIKSAAVMTINDQGFKNLMLNNNLSSNLDPILTDLKRLFGARKEFVDFTNDAADKNAASYIEWLKLNTTWYNNDYYGNRGKLTDEQINFYFTDNSLFKNWLVAYYNEAIDGQYRSTMAFRHYAFEAYKDLTEILKLNKEETDSFSISLTDQEKQQILGTYQNNEQTYTVVLKNNKLYANINDREDELFFINKTFFIPNRNLIRGFRTVNLDENKNVTGFTFRNGNNELEFKKIKKAQQRTEIKNKSFLH